VKAGLLLQHPEQKHLYDRFRHGIMIPIRNSAGRILAFGMRSLDENSEGPKYINSPDSALYHKSDILFGLDRARKAIRQDGFGLIVEGYFDVLSLWQAGIENAVASCGTAFTSSHAAMLARFCDSATIFYDGDSAGLTATYRALEPLLGQEMLVKIARPPDGMDPDDVARKWEEDRVRELISGAHDWFDFSIQTAQAGGLWDSVEGKMKFADRIAPYIAALKNNIMATLYRRKLAEILGVSDAQIGALISKVMKRTGTVGSASDKPAQEEALPSDACAELDLLVAIIANPNLCERVVEAQTVVLYGGALNRISQEIAHVGECSVMALADVLEKRAMSYITRALLEQKDFPTNADIDEILTCLERKRLEIRNSALRLNLKEAERAGDGEKALAILGEISEINRKMVEISGDQNARKEFYGRQR